MTSVSPEVTLEESERDRLREFFRGHFEGEAHRASEAVLEKEREVRAQAEKVARLKDLDAASERVRSAPRRRRFGPVRLPGR